VDEKERVAQIVERALVLSPCVCVCVHIFVFLMLSSCDRKVLTSFYLSKRFRGSEATRCPLGVGKIQSGLERRRRRVFTILRLGLVPKVWGIREESGKPFQ